MSAEVFIECPFCREKRANYLIKNLWILKPESLGRIRDDARNRLQAAKEKIE